VAQRTIHSVARAVLAACLLLPGACIVSNDFGGTAFLCAEEPICPSGFICVEGRCVAEVGGGDGGTEQSDFRARRKLTFDNSGRAALDRFPLLVLLDPGRIDYDQLRDDGADLQFRDADGSPLPHEVEVWSPGGQSAIWVHVPRIEANSGDDHIWMYYGDPDAQIKEDQAAVWTSYRVVYHLNTGIGDQVNDSTGQGYGGTAVGGQLIPGPVGEARSFDGVDDHIILGTGRDFASGVSGMTMEAWVRPLANTGAGVVFGATINGGEDSRAELQVLGDLTVRGGGRTIDGGSLLTATGPPIISDKWTWVVTTFDFPADAIAVYYDGVQVTAASGLGFGPATPATTSDLAVIGVNENLTTAFFQGGIDEVRLATDSRSPDWVAAQYASMVDQLVSYGPAEEL
jgi:hypothetical protein